MTESAWKSDRKNKGKDKNDITVSQMLSLDYRKISFKLSLIGSDSVVQALNNLYQYFYSRDEKNEMTINDTKRMLSLLGNFLLEIRKSMGNEAATLDNWDMLEWFITDARQYRDN